MANAKHLARKLFDLGFKVQGEQFGFTETHQVAIDMTDFGGGDTAARDLKDNRIIVNMNLLPFEPLAHATSPAGIRIGVQEMTRVGMKEAEMDRIAELFKRCLHGKEVRGRRSERDALALPAGRLLLRRAGLSAPVRANPEQTRIEQTLTSRRPRPIVRPFLNRGRRKEGTARHAHYRRTDQLDAQADPGGDRERKTAHTSRTSRKKQAEAGAAWVDVNAGAFPNDEVERVQWLVSVIREVSEVPLSIDSPRPAAVEAGLAMAGKDPFLNSISAESERYKALIPLLKKYGARVVALSLDDGGMTDDMGRVWEVADGLIKRLEDDGIPPDHIFVDPLIRPVSTSPDYGMGALGVVERITEKHPQVHKTCGLSNVSYGLPRRKLLNQVFVAMAVAKGMDSAIVDPLDPRMMANILAAEALAGRDQFCMAYITAERGGRFEGMG